MGNHLEGRARKRVKDRNTIKCETRCDQFDQTLSNAGDSNASRRFALERGHGQEIAAALHEAERFDIRINIEYKSESRNLLVDRDAKLSDGPAIHSHARAEHVYRPAEFIILEEFNHHILKVVEKPNDRSSNGMERDDWITGHLTRQMEDRPATSPHPSHPPPMGH